MSDNTGSNNDTNGSNNNNTVVMPVPQPVIVKAETRIVILTKFLSWLTAVLLATAVIISLVSVTSERNDLRNQLLTQSKELTCRSAASIDVNKATGIRDNLIAKALIYVADSDIEGLRALVQPLKDATDGVTTALDDQEAALLSCSE